MSTMGIKPRWAKVLRPKRSPAQNPKKSEMENARSSSQAVVTRADGRPWVVPMLYGRAGDRILMHGSVGARLMRQAGRRALG